MAVFGNIHFGFEVKIKSLVIIIVIIRHAFCNKLSPGLPDSICFYLLGKNVFSDKMVDQIVYLWKYNHENHIV